MIENLSRPPRPTPPQGSGVPKLQRREPLEMQLAKQKLQQGTTINFHVGYMPFADSSKIIDEIIEKYGGKCKLDISTTLKNSDGTPELVFEDTYPEDNYTGTETALNINDITDKIIVGGIVKDWHYDHNALELRWIVSLNCGNVTDTILIISSRAMPTEIKKNDFLKCAVKLVQCGSALEPCYQLMVFNKSDIIQHIKKNFAQETKEDI
jgi:hypothetical protein